MFRKRIYYMTFIFIYIYIDDLLKEITTETRTYNLINIGIDYINLVFNYVN